MRKLEDYTPEQLERFDRNHPTSVFITVRLGGNPEDYYIEKAIKTYVALHGIKMKRAFLIGIAEFINKNGDNPDLVLDIANYIVEDAKRAVKKQMRSKKGQRRKTVHYQTRLQKQAIKEAYEAKIAEDLANIDQSELVDAFDSVEPGAQPADSSV